MQDLAPHLFEDPAPSILSLIRELTVGQRPIETPELLSGFLHTEIFPKLGNVLAEIYFPEKDGASFLPPKTWDAWKGRNTAIEKVNLPQKIPADLPIINQLIKTSSPLLLPRQFLAENKNSPLSPGSSRLLAPIMDGAELCALLLLKNRDTGSFSQTYIEEIQTLAAVIGSRLKSMATIQELKEVKERAERAEKNKGTFLANISHEIRTPIHGVIGLSDLVLHSGISGQQRSYLEMIHSSSERLLKLVNNILDFSKIEAGKLELDITSFSLRNSIADVMEILAVSAAAKNIDLKVDCPKQLPDTLRGDGGKLGQILINLLANGIKFTEKGFVELSIRQQGQYIQRAGSDVDFHFQVKDSGVGIPPDKIKNIFKPFSQIESNCEPGLRGTGLGLVIAAELVELMGGRIGVESTSGVGTTFYFSVRFSAQQAIDQKKEKTLPSQPLKTQNRSMRILLVEDEPISQTLAVKLLEREGWSVVVADNGMQALEILNKDNFDLILMDLQMPGLDGFETTKNIRMMEKEIGTHVPVIAMTARTMDGDIKKCSEVGMDGYLSKPISPDILMQELSRIVEKLVDRGINCTTPGPLVKNKILTRQLNPQTP